jgi:hypothetical protein
MNVLEGALSSIQSFRPTIIIELYEEALRDAGSSSASLLNFFDQLGYLPYSEQGQRLDYSVLLSEIERAPSVSRNIIACSNTSVNEAFCRDSVSHRKNETQFLHGIRR